MSFWASPTSMVSCCESPNADSPYARPYDIALIFERIAGVTSAAGTSNTRDPT